MSQKRTWLLALMLVAALVFAGCAAPPAAAPAADDGAMAEDSGEMADDSMADGEMMMDWEGVDPSGQQVIF